MNFKHIYCRLALILCKHPQMYDKEYGVIIERYWYKVNLILRVPGNSCQNNGCLMAERIDHSFSIL